MVFGGYSPSIPTLFLSEGKQFTYSYYADTFIYDYPRANNSDLPLYASTDPEKVVEQKKLARELDAVRIQLLSDLCDVAIPAAALGWVNLDDGIVGLAGTTSSLLGVWSQWKKTA